MLKVMFSCELSFNSGSWRVFHTATGSFAEVSADTRRPPDGETWSTIGHRELRTHVSVARLIEISPVSLPAYGFTTVQLRSLEHITHPDSVRSQATRARARVNLPRGNN